MFVLKKIHKKIFFFIRFVESGIIHHWMRHIDYPKGKHFMLQFFDKKFNRFPDHNPLSLENVLSGFFVLIVGLVISFIVFLVEVFVNYFCFVF